uniref:hypothetical protein n=1 Tax=Staphylococcus haemolyticus TaxID=1283 RepID=UPI001C92FDDD
LIKIANQVTNLINSIPFKTLHNQLTALNPLTHQIPHYSHQPLQPKTPHFKQPLHKPQTTFHKLFPEPYPTIPQPS